jgi:hypothetical protein
LNIFDILNMIDGNVGIVRTGQLCRSPDCISLSVLVRSVTIEFCESYVYMIYGILYMVVFSYYVPYVIQTISSYDVMFLLRA